MDRKQEQREHLRAQYHAAFGTWVAQVHHSRQVSHSGENNEKVEMALAAYREARNRWADDLADTRAQGVGG